MAQLARESITVVTDYQRPDWREQEQAVIEAALQAHGDLYERSGSGARLRIRDGTLAVGSLQGPGYGCEQTVIDALDRELDWQTIP